MLNRAGITALLVLLSISSCKKQHVKKMPKKNSKRAERNNMFLPVSESEAKKFVDSFVKKGQSTQETTSYAQQADIGSVGAQELDNMVRFNEAKLSDVPIPLNSKPLREYFEQCVVDKKIVLGYVSDIEIADILAFYNNQMERLGWKRAAFFDGFEKLMIFKKPLKFCSVSIRAYPCLQKRKQEYTKIVICTQF